MRVIGGKFKSRRIAFPKTFSTRPVTDRAKETIFNILGSSCESAIVLDLFAGSGSLGIEALSRGAEIAYFVESAKAAVLCIRQNLETLGLNTLGTVFRGSVDLAIDKLAKQSKRFAIIFLDPPHNKGLIKKTLHHLDRSDIVAAFGIIVVGHSNREGPPQDLKTLRHQRSVKIGQTFMSFLTRI